MEQHEVSKMKTALYERHRSLDARMVDFQGWEMPLHYKGILHEHHKVRKEVGLFDVSHMGRILVKGQEAEIFLDYLSTNKIASKSDFSATYTTWANSEGGCIDDVIIYKHPSQNYSVIVNASNRQKDLDHIKKYSRSFEVQIEEHFDTDGILAVQGPLALDLAGRIFPEALPIKPMRFQSISYKKTPIILSGTGYTGAGGFEIYASNPIIVDLWDRLLEDGKTFGIEPVGLGARDTLRIEKGYALYGHELSDSIAPTESVAAWTVHWNKDDFLGKNKLVELETNPLKRSSYGMVLLDKGIAREGSEIYDEGRLVGKVTSGTFSPTLNKSIAIICVQGQYNIKQKLEVEIRQRRIPAEIVALPFL
jgi:aminomethyltransferase